MSRKCKVSQVKGKVGNNVSHSKRRTRMRQDVNLQWKRFWLEEEKRWVRLRVSTRIIRTITKKGLARTLKSYGFTSVDQLATAS